MAIVVLNKTENNVGKEENAGGLVVRESAA